MRAFLIRFLFVIFASSVIWSCKTDKRIDAPNNIAYDSISVSRIYHLDNDSTKPSCSVKIQYVYPIEYVDAEVLAKIQGELNFIMLEDESYEKLSPADAADKYIKDYIENYKKDAKEQFPDWETSGDSEDYYSYYKTLNSKVVYDMADIMSYQVSAMDYKGGANSSTAYRNVVIDLKTGDMLSEKDIFVSDYKKDLNALLIRKIVEKNKVQKPEDLLEFGYWIDDLTSNNNFYVDDKGITYIFNPGEYSASTMGEIKVFLTYDELNTILKDNSPIAVFYRQ